jgi:hypothetical protein
MSILAIALGRFRFRLDFCLQSGERLFNELSNRLATAGLLVPRMRSQVHHTDRHRGDHAQCGSALGLSSLRLPGRRDVPGRPLGLLALVHTLVAASPKAAFVAMQQFPGDVEPPVRTVRATPN